MEKVCLKPFWNDAEVSCILAVFYYKHSTQCCSQALIASPALFCVNEQPRICLLAPNVLLTLDDAISDEHPRCWKAASQALEALLLFWSWRCC